MSISSAELLSRVDAISEVIVNHRAQAEHNAELSSPVVQALHSSGLTNLYLPRALGGLEAAPLAVAEAVEAVARLDTAAAWMLMVANVPRFLASSWPAELVEEVWGEQPHALAAISGNQIFSATPCAGGYRVSGHTGFASGCNHAQWFMAPARIEDDVRPDTVAAPGTLRGPDPAKSPGPKRGMLLLRMADCEVMPNWDVLGMRGTGSHDVRATDLFVASRYLIRFGPGSTANHYYSGPLYHCARRVVFATYVPISLAVAERGLAALSGLAESKVPYASEQTLKHRALAQHKFGRALALYRSGRLYFHDALARAMANAEAGAVPSERQRADLYLASVQAVQSAAESLRLVADAAGTSIIYAQSPFERLVRDMEVLRQHGFTSDNRYANVAQVYWGAALDYPALLL